MRWKLFLVIVNIIMLAGCITPAVKDSRGMNTPILNAYQAALPDDDPSPWNFPMTPQNQAYAITGGVLLLMVFIIIRASQFKDK